MNLSQVWNWLREKPTKPEMIANDTMVVMKVPITPTIRRNHHRTPFARKHRKTVQKARRTVHCHYCKKTGHYQPTCPLARKRVRRALGLSKTKTLRR